MTKKRHHFQESLKSLFGSLIDPEKDEQLKETKTEIDDKVKRILKVKEEDLEGQNGLSEENSKKDPLLELIVDLQKQYHSLYTQYDDLKGELRDKAHGKDTSSSSSSDSESDDSSKHKGSKNGRLESDYQKIIDGMKQKLEAANQELAELKSKLTATGEEKDALKMEHQTGLIKIREAEEIIRNLKLEMVSRSKESSIHVEGLMDQVNVLQQQLETLHSQKAELGVQLEKKTLEISEYLIQIENLKEEILSKTADQQRVQAEKESCTEQINDLELEVKALCNQNTELGEQISTEIKEKELLGEEMVRLQEKILELEKTRAERDLEFSFLQERHSTGENEASAQIMALTELASNQQQELDSLRAEKNQTQSHFEKEREEFSEKLIELENQKSDFMSQIAEQQRMLDEEEEARKKLNEEHKQVEGWFQECKASLEVAERKVEDMAEEFRKNTGSKDEMVEQLEEMIEDLRRDLEVKGDEINTLVENVRNIEVTLRLSNQKLRVTEQLLTEKEESSRKAEERHQQEQRVLKERAAILSGIITANNEAYHRMVADISEQVKQFFVRTGCSGHEIRRRLQQLQDTKERESALKEMVEQLEVKVRMEGAEKENLTKAISQLEKKLGALEKTLKEKDEGISDLGEEKREAIRQLCVWIEYHRSRYDYLRETLSRMPLRSQRSS
ncbi:COP1-INTERACTIVE PROTEIN 1 [Salix koriyanagi]|uniref:COP1-INTERACTIVE PROTEIN 1 n=1 Tax=Salix koriyanagi TaxID=2511006 RepID=A0A9Q0Q839_9ROSI|nr:COP1-INTERACTIVE PROTEIN 1 [Salix koriyanagi]